jgi:AcrR family transcriptional regulator
MAELRERKKAALRDTIVRAAVDLFTAQGYDAVSVDEIVAASMCSRSTFTRYFGSKEDVLFPGSKEATSTFRASLAAVEPGVNRWHAARAALIDGQVNFFAAFDPEVRTSCLRLWFTEAGPRRRYLEFVYEWETILLEFFAAGAPVGSEAWVRSQMIAAAMIGGQRAAMYAAIESDEDVRVVTHHVYDVLEAGLGPGTLDQD